MPNQIHRLFESLESRTLLHAGDIDPAFNSGQLQTTSFPSLTASASVVDPFPDGSFLVGGAIFQKSHANDETNGTYQEAGIGIAKYDFDGSLDTTFGDSGEISGTPRGLFYMKQIVNTPDGGFILFGYDTDSSPLLIKYTAAGQIDTTFAKNGKLSPDSFTGTTTNIAVDSAGRILVPGENGTYDADLRRYLPDGTLDTTFGTNGDYIEDPNPHSKGFDFHERVFSNVALTSTGDIIVTGDENIDQIDPDDNSSSTISYTPIVREVTHNGTPVKPFDANTSAANFSLNGFEIVAGVSADGNIVLTGDQLMELKSDGTLNTAFGDNGISGVIPDVPDTVAVAQDGSIVMAFPVQSDITHQFALRRVLSTGKLDKNFGTNGKLLLATTTDDDIDFKIGVAIAPDGTAVAASQAGGLSPSGKVDTRQFEIARVFTTEGPAVQLIPRTIKSNTTSIKVTALIRDNDGVDTLTLDNHDLKVLDPANVSGENFFQRMHFVSSTQIDGDKYVQVTYRISSPNFTVPEATPTWDSLDNGTYQIRLAGSQIDDLLANPAEAQTLGTITVEIPATA